MNPYVAAQQVYLREDSTATFLYDLTMHMENPTAWVLKTPELFCLARPVDSTAEEDQIIDARYYFGRERWNAWYLCLYAGSVTEILRNVPFRLPLCGWQKRNRLRFWPAEDIDRLFLRNRHDLPPTDSVPQSTRPQEL